MAKFDKTNNIFWRPVLHQETEVLERAVQFEREFPSFYRNSGNSWTKDDKEVIEFYKFCRDLFGIFENDSVDGLIGLIYCEAVTEDVINIHFDMKRKSNLLEIIECLKQMRDYQFLNGVRICSTWVLKKNKAIALMLHQIGFLPTFLTMRHGSSHNQVLEWEQYSVAK